jgi:hypothetical protein
MADDIDSAEKFLAKGASPFHQVRVVCEESSIRRI